MWLPFLTGGDSVMDRPICRLVHYLIGVNVLCLIAAQGLALALLGRHARISFGWFIASVVLILAHIAFAILFTWIDGEEFRRDDGSGSGGNSSSDGSGGDGSSCDGSGGGGDGSSCAS